MKKTTYILIGALLALFVLVVLFPPYIKCISQKGSSKVEKLTFTDKKISKNYQGVKSIVFMSKNEGAELIGCNTKITSSTNDLTTVTLPESKFLTITQKKDTLFVTTDIKINDNQKILQRKIIDINVKAPAILNSIKYDYGYIVSLNNMNGDSISLALDRNCEINNSTFRAISASGWGMNLKIKGSTIDSLYIDADNNSNWTAEKCNINTEFITSSDYIENNITENECKKIVWTPKGDKSKIALSGNQKFIITPCNK